MHLYELKNVYDGKNQGRIGRDWIYHVRLRDIPTPGACSHVK
jgi:hypothetical protein